MNSHKEPRLIFDIWQNQPVSGERIAPEQLNQASDRFARRIRRRNLREAIAAAIVVTIFSGYAWFLPGSLQKAGSVLVVLAALWVTWQLRRRGSPGKPDKSVAVPCLNFHRAELVRQRDLLASIWSWYLAPFVPGMALCLFGTAANADASAPGHRTAIALGLIPVILIVVGVFFFVYRLNRAAARRLDGKIAAIDALLVLGPGAATDRP